MATYFWFFQLVVQIAQVMSNFKTDVPVTGDDFDVEEAERAERRTKD